VRWYYSNQLNFLISFQTQTAKKAIVVEILNAKVGQMAPDIHLDKYTILKIDNVERFPGNYTSFS